MTRLETAIRNSVEVIEGRRDRDPINQILRNQIVIMETLQEIKDKAR